MVVGSSHIFDLFKLSGRNPFHGKHKADQQMYLKEEILT